MSLEDGMAALRLEMPDTIPRTEYSAHNHWELVNQVIGTEITPETDKEMQRAASSAFIKAWDYGFFHRTSVGASIFGDLQTRLGHAVYAAGGVDFTTERSCPFETPEEVLAFDPWERFGPIDRGAVDRDVRQAYREMLEFAPECVNTGGVYVTLISGFIALFGFEMMFMAAGTDPEGFGRLADRYASWIRQYTEVLAESDIPVILMHDDHVMTSGPYFHPDWYRRYVFPNYRRIFEPILDAGKRLVFNSDGDYTCFIDDIVDAGVHGLIMEPYVDMEHIAERYGRRIAFIGNVDTRALLFGDKAEIEAEVKRCMDIGKQCPGFFLAVGNHIPPNTPVDNALYYEELYRKYRKR
jgi:hypothetical protein